MSTRSTIVTPAGTSPCGCGGHDDGDKCPGTCCTLGALVRPQFFCGQMLSDQDLTALIRWTREKAVLQRFRDGWGVVCGLDVHCDASCPGGVVVDPGYAVSCCGDDIVVDGTSELAKRCIDLTPWCGVEADPCTDPYAPASGGQQQSATASRLLRGGLLEPIFPAGEPDELRAVDIAIRYCETSGEPQETLAHDACGQGGRCHDTRTCETFKLVARAAPPESDPVEALAKRWAAEYAACTDVLKAYTEAVATRDADTVRPWLLAWLRKHPTRCFCFLHESICQLEDKEFTDEESIVRLLLIFVLDCRHSFLTCGCHDCDEDHGVPLARVWLRSDPAQGGRCRVIAVDPTPPYRRPLAPTCWPAPHGMINVGQVIGQREGDACTRLADLGVHVRGTVDFALPGTVADLQAELDCKPYVECGATPQMQVIDLGLELGRRALGFCGQSDSRAAKSRGRRKSS